ncbi:MAG: hypothetical protein IH586_22415 [Anaerolineaceae bacterium]|nr:hypothetical protein [Anaerolineaceae bacterium]
MRKIKITHLLIVVLCTTFLLVSCNLPSNTTPTPDAKAIITEAAITVAAQLTQSAKLTPSLSPTLASTATKTQEAPKATLEGPTPPAAPTNTPKATNGPAGTPDSASFVADVTVPDGTGAAPGAVFEKTWRIKNSGTTTWSPAYSLVWVDGEKMGSPESIAIPKEVRPDETVDISVKLTAPTKAGTYQTFFRLRNASGQYFKLDGSGDLWVKIIVGLASTNTPNSQTLTPNATPETLTPTP